MKDDIFGRKRFIERGANLFPILTKPIETGHAVFPNKTQTISIDTDYKSNSVADGSKDGIREIYTESEWNEKRRQVEKDFASMEKPAEIPEGASTLGVTESKSRFGNKVCGKCGQKVANAHYKEHQDDCHPRKTFDMTKPSNIV